MALDLLLRQGRRTEDKETLVDIAVADGRIVEIAQRISAEGPTEDIDRRGSLCSPSSAAAAASPAPPPLYIVPSRATP
jgi:dihydroorotase-like cyclic amidohydrolase